MSSEWTPEHRARKARAPSSCPAVHPDRLLSKIEYDTNGGCWLWTANMAEGYGRLMMDGKLQKAHRVSWATFRSDPGDLCVLHRCDTPACINPDHLFLGTNDDNIADMVAKNRHPRGERKPLAKLTAKDIEEIRRPPYVRGLRNQLASLYGVNPTTIHRIRMRRTWDHI